jgi:hypothetical protein
MVALAALDRLAFLLRAVDGLEGDPDVPSQVPDDALHATGEW